MKSMKELATCITLQEKKKSSVSIGNVREILSLLSDLAVKDPSCLALLIQNGMKRKKGQKK